MPRPSRPIVIRIHHNRRGAPKLPWTIHTSRGCWGCSHFTIGPGVVMESEEKPDNKNNPRYFLKVRGVLSWRGSAAHIS